MGAWVSRYNSSKKRAEGGYDRLSFNIDGKGLDIVQTLIDAFPERVHKSLKRAIHRAGQGCFKNVKKSIRERYNIKAEDIKANIIYRDNRKNNHYDEEILLVSKRFNLAYFSPRPNYIGGKRPKQGVSVLVNRQIGRFKIAGAFPANLYNTDDTRTPFRLYRRKDYGVEPYTRFPIKSLYGPSLPQMINEEEKFKILKTIEERFVKEFTHEMTKGFKY